MLILFYFLSYLCSLCVCCLMEEENNLNTTGVPQVALLWSRHFPLAAPPLTPFSMSKMLSHPGCDRNAITRMGVLWGWLSSLNITPRVNSPIIHGSMVHNFYCTVVFHRTGAPQTIHPFTWWVYVTDSAFRYYKIHICVQIFVWTRVFPWKIGTSKSIVSTCVELYKKLSKLSNCFPAWQHYFTFPTIYIYGESSFLTSSSTFVALLLLRFLF